jgi:hypothetical protein
MSNNKNATKQTEVRVSSRIETEKCQMGNLVEGYKPLFKDLSEQYPIRAAGSRNSKYPSLSITSNAFSILVIDAQPSLNLLVASLFVKIN